MPFSPEPAFSHGQAEHTGVLLCNLGTPDAPTAAAVRRYLAEFLRDPRVVEIPRAVWLPILYGLILPFRPARSAAKYASIWTASGSPLKLSMMIFAAAARRMALQTARLTTVKTLSGYDFSFQPSLDRNRVLALAQQDFVERRQCVHFLAPPGNGQVPPGDRPGGRGDQSRQAACISPPWPSG